MASAVHPVGSLARRVLVCAGASSLRTHEASRAAVLSSKTRAFPQEEEGPVLRLEARVWLAALRVAGCLA